jgi:hypothetical protein
VSSHGLHGNRRHSQGAVRKKNNGRRCARLRHKLIMAGISRGAASHNSVPFAVTYCPLCDSAAVVDRRTAEGEVDFGVSGLLYNSNVLLYDRSKSNEPSLWSQMMAQSVAGPRVKMFIKSLPVELTTWRNWVARRPETKVLSTDTGYVRDYSRFAYERNFRTTRLAFPVRPLGRRLPANTPVLGVWSGRVARAYPSIVLEEHSEAMEIDHAVNG